MKRIALALALTAAAITAPALAQQVHDHNTHLPGMDHSMLASSSPADGAVLAIAPQRLVLTFRHAVALQTLSITNAHGAATPVEWQREPHRRTYSIALPALPDGTYRIAFTATDAGGTDTMPGEIRFVVRQ
ncbi:MAG: hypothetical protein BroJett013_25250 [Alphaproteobacteria bacterium]|nr:MAG: hypothetical protein BroJett013_25250 [Alphaproteobacteria bacterium]